MAEEALVAAVAPSNVAIGAAANAAAALEAAKEAKTMAEEALVAAGGEIPLPDTPPAANQAMAIAQATKAELDAFRAQLTRAARAHANELHRVPKRPLDIPPVEEMDSPVL